LSNKVSEIKKINIDVSLSNRFEDYKEELKSEGKAYYEDGMKTINSTVEEA